MTRLYIVRHGNTFEAGETPRRIGASTDLPLTTTGVAQAEALGQHFAGRVAFARAFSSPLRRTRSTAEAILARQVHPPLLETLTLLTEIDHGPDENRTEDEVVARIGGSAIALWDEKGIAPDGWNAGADWRLPGWRDFAASLCAEHPDDAILLVTSNGAARFALLAFDSKSVDKIGNYKLRTASYALIELDCDRRIRLLDWGRRPD